MLAFAFSLAMYILVAAVIAALFVFPGIIRYIPNNRVGIGEKLWSVKGPVKNGFMALNGEVGFQPEVLRGGFHFFLPFQYRIHKMSLVSIPQGKIGYIFARDGAPLASTQTLASNEKDYSYEDASGFIQNGGQKGPQRKILREGTYAINLAQFVIITSERVFGLMLEKNDEVEFARMERDISLRQGFEPIVLKNANDEMGIITVHDGPSLPSDQIIAPKIGEDATNAATFHNNFQDPEAFLKAGGFRGRQLQVLTEGTYYINRLFATVEMKPKTVIEVGTVGVVVSYVGDIGADNSGEEYRHGELVEVGKRGVWQTPLLPGKYAFNTYAGKIVTVPTTNFILKWDRSTTGTHRLDENLSEVSLITQDAFEPTLPLSVVAHIDYRKAPLVVQRFGDVKRLVEQTLDPMVSAYFKNVGQTRTLIQLLQERSEIQEVAATGMQEKFSHYNLELEEVLIGTPKAGDNEKGGEQIEKILAQLRSRQIAEEQVGTYAQQEKSAAAERQLRETEARAKQQTAITESELSIMVQENEGKATLAKATQEANTIRMLAQAKADETSLLALGEAKRVEVMAAAEADRVTRVGIAEGIAIEEQVRAFGGAKYQLTHQVMTRFSEAIEHGKIDVVPKISITGQGGAGSGTNNIMESLLTLFLSDKLGIDAATTRTDPTVEVSAIKDDLIRAVKPGSKKAGQMKEDQVSA
jgi:uncharacterized membrane protein YqiK